MEHKTLDLNIVNCHNEDFVKIIQMEISKFEYINTPKLGNMNKLEDQV
jgi:hypothetical protein